MLLAKALKLVMFWILKCLALLGRNALWIDQLILKTLLGMKIFVNRFGYLNAKSDVLSKEASPEKIDCDKALSICLNAFEGDENLNLVDKGMGNVGLNDENGEPFGKALVNPWVKRPNIKVRLSEDGSFLTVDRMRVKLHEPSVLSNLKKL